jgi:hypothetical protein
MEKKMQTEKMYQQRAVKACLPRYQVSNFKFLVSSFRYPVSSIQYQVSAIKFRVSSFQYLVSAIKFPQVIQRAFRIIEFLVVIAVSVHPLRAVAQSTGVPVSYQLPVTGDLPQTYLVTLAVTDRQDPDWIVSTFVAGEPRTVTAENKGKFMETWNGLDENFMPVPPGKYGVKGIYSQAKKWDVDGEWHAITPLWAGGVSPWLPSPEMSEHWKIPIPFEGDPVNAPLLDVDVASNGVAVFYYQYLENGKNCPMFDLNKPTDYRQFIRAFNSGGAGGGPCVVTDGDTVWAFSTDGGEKFIYRADGRSFGESPNANRRNAYLPEGWVTGMAVLSDPRSKKNYIYAAQRGKILCIQDPRNPKWSGYKESTTDFVDKITIHDGDNGKILGEITLPRPQSLVVRNNRLYALSILGKSATVSFIRLDNGLPQGSWETVFSVPASIAPFDLEVDKSNRYYLSDTEANKVYQLDVGGKILRTFGRLGVQKPGSYDQETLMAPGKLATWTDSKGQDRLIIVEYAGPNRVSEWRADDGKLLREFPSYQTKANNGYAVDPADPSLIYMPGHRNWLTRFRVDYKTREWKVDAVWPDVEAGQHKGLDKPDAIRAGKTLYLASARNLSVYRLSAAGDRWLKSAGEISKEKEHFLWNDANGNGEVDDDELRPMTLPGRVITYHGQKWLPDFSYVAMAQEGRDLWRLAPAGFDSHGNPVFKEWQKVLTDPVFEARAGGTADAIHGGNELADKFSSDWMMADGSMKDGFYIQARGGRNFTANFGAQHKITRYVPDGKGGYKMKWRVGRSKLGSQAARGEIAGGMRLFKPINGLLTVIDQSRSGLFLYTEDGMYVDTLFPPGEIKEEIGVYRQPGEFFAGTVYPNSENGKIYYASGKYTAFLYEIQNWSLKQNPVQKLTDLPKEISISASQIADPPEIAITLRGGAGKTSIVRFAPALGGVELDGSLTGWESAEPVSYGAGKEQLVEVRCLYDPNNLYFRWHVRTGGEFRPGQMPPPERVFTHDQKSDTVGFYIQGDANTPSGKSADGRPGDVRMVFGIFKEGDKLKPVVVGLYPDWQGKGAQPQTYRTPVGAATFAHVGAVAGAKLQHLIDEDGKGFVIAAVIPRSAVPAMKKPFSGKLRTLVNFDANLGGHNKFWWANTDGSANLETYDEPSEARFYPGCWASAIFQSISEGVPIRNWLTVGPFGGPGADKFVWDPRNKEEVRRFFEAAAYPPDNCKVDVREIFQGPVIEGYWDKLKQITWKPATIADLDTRVLLGGGSQVWYGAAWIYAPGETDVEFDFQIHQMTYTRWFLNDQKLDTPEDYNKYKDNETMHRRSFSSGVRLKSGWNQVFFRAYCVGYSPFRIGLVLKASPEKLWLLRFSNQPK